MAEKVFVAMSGGVDSSVAALLLKQQGYDVTGITMQVWPAEKECSKTCCGLEAIHDARRVCWKIDVPHYVMNFRDEFNSRVVDYFCREYLRGRTPNPCIDCNRFIKFESFRRKSLAMGADFIATGHYARVDFDEITGKHQLLRAKDAHKDQTYALYSLSQEQLRHILFPLGDLCKEEVRKIAREADLPVAEKAESQEICFISEGHYAEFVENFLGVSPRTGPIIDTEGHILGYHQGIHHYTIGQRKGLGIATGSPVYVNCLDADSNAVKVGGLQDLYKGSLSANDVSYIAGEAPDEKLPVTVKIRYSAPDVPAWLIPGESNRIRIDFLTPQKAVTPGQAAVMYQGEKVLGGATICETYA